MLDNFAHQIHKSLDNGSRGVLEWGKHAPSEIVLQWSLTIQSWGRNSCCTWCFQSLCQQIAILQCPVVHRQDDQFHSLLTGRTRIYCSFTCEEERKSPLLVQSSMDPFGIMLYEPTTMANALHFCSPKEFPKRHGMSWPTICSVWVFWHVLAPSCTIRIHNRSWVFVRLGFQPLQEALRQEVIRAKKRLAWSSEHCWQHQ